MEDFIAVYEQALPSAVCESIISRFEASQKRVRGQTGMGVDPSKKDSWDARITGDPHWDDVQKQLIDATFPYLLDYVRKFPFLVAGALSLQVQDQQTGDTFTLTSDQMGRVPDDQLRSIIMLVYRSGILNLQKYEQAVGGYHHWHSEIYPRDPHCETLHRVLLYMFYLNDVDEGGETEFFYQQRKLKPKQGTLVIAPAGFTHTHKGHVPRSGDKYIVTSWVMFNRAETIYQVNRK